MANGAGQTLQTEYLRRVRRLRGQYAGSPGELHRRLRELSTGAAVAKRGAGAGGRLRPVRSRGVENPFGEARSAGVVPGVSAVAQAQFAELVTTRMQAGILRYSCRVELLGIAKEMGLGRFEANLVIATVQHRAKKRHAADERASMMSGAAIAGVIVLVQAAIVGAIGWVFSL